MLGIAVNLLVKSSILEMLYTILIRIRERGNYYRNWPIERISRERDLQICQVCFYLLVNCPRSIFLFSFFFNSDHAKVLLNDMKYNVFGAN